MKRAQVKQGFTQLVSDLSKAFKPNGWLLSATVSADPSAVDASYDVPQLMDHFDWISLMTYDYYNSYGGQTEHIAPLYATNNLNIDATVKYWIKKGVPPHNLIVGISTAGLSFTLKNPKNNGLYAPSSGPGETGTGTNIPGSLAYYEICNKTKQNGWTVVRDQIGPYAYHDNQWVSFDDVENIHAKAKYIRDMNLGGGMVWTLDFDDFRGSCGCGKYPLLTALNQDLRHIDRKSVENCT